MNRVRPIAFSLLLCFVMNLFFAIPISFAQGQFQQGYTGPHRSGDGLGQLETTGTFSSGKNGVDNSPLDRGFFRPIDVVMDTTRNRLFVSDFFNNRILAFTLNSNNTIGDRFGDFLLGQRFITVNTAAVNQATLNSPSGMCIDSTRLFVADTGANRVMVFDITSLVSPGSSNSAINVLGQANFTSSAAATTQAGMNGPRDCAVAGNYLFVSDNLNHRVLRYNISDGITNGENADLVLGQSLFTTSTAPDPPTSSSMYGPYGLAYDSAGNRLFVADQGNSRILIFNNATTLSVNGSAADNVIGQVSLTSNAASTTISTLNQANGVIYDSAHNFLYVSDTANNRMLKFDASTITNGKAAHSVIGQTSFTVSTAGTSTTKMSGPSLGMFDTVNNVLLLADNGNNRVLQFPIANLITGGAADNGFGQHDTSNAMHFTKAGENDSPSHHGFNNPHSVTIDTVGHRLFVSDETNNRILIFNLASDNTLSDRFADNAVGAPDMFGPITGGSTAALVNLPAGLAYDEVRSRLFVADRGNNRVLVFNLSDGLTNGESAQYVLGWPSFTPAPASLTQSGMSSPIGLAFDSGNNRLYVADNGYNRVMAFDLTNIANGMSASNLLGQVDGGGNPVYTTSTAATTTTGMNQPSSLALDTTNHFLYVADQGNNRVLRFDLDSNNNLIDRTADAVLGQSLFTTATAATTQSGLSGPKGVAIDANQQLFVADVNARVLVFNVASITNGENAAAVFCQTNYTGATAGVSTSQCDYPLGMAINASLNTLYLPEYNNHRVSQYRLVRITTTSLSDATYNTSYSATILKTDGDANGSFVYSVASGSLPTGLTLTSSSNNGLLSGTPTVTGSFTFTIRATATVNSTGDTIDDQSFTFNVKPRAVTSPSTTAPSTGTAQICWTDTLNGSGTTYTVTNSTSGATVGTTSSTCITESGLAGGTYTYSIVATGNSINSDATTTSATVSAASAPAPAAAAPLPQYLPPPAPSPAAEPKVEEEPEKISEPQELPPSETSPPRVEIKPEEIPPLSTINGTKPPETISIPVSRPAQITVRPRTVTRSLSRVEMETRVTEPQVIPAVEMIEQKNRALLERKLTAEEKVTLKETIVELDKTDVSPEVSLLEKQCERNRSECNKLYPEKSFKAARLEEIGIDIDPDEPLTRAEALAIVLRDANLVPTLAPDELETVLDGEIPAPLLSDTASTSKDDIWVPVAVNTACELKIIDCSPGLLFAPDAAASKSDVQLFLQAASAAVTAGGGSGLTAQKDSDFDGLNDTEEKLVYKTDPKNPDSDGDGLNDGSELKIHKTNPFSADSDGDSIGDFNEVRKIGSSPLKVDTDDDCFSDPMEIAAGTSPKNKKSVPQDKNKNCIPDSLDKKVKTEVKTGLTDTDGDGLYDKKEIELGLNPESADTDRDGIKDGEEVNDLKTNPKTFTTLEQVETQIANVRDGQTMGSKNFLVKGSAARNMKVKITLRNDFGLEKVVAQTVASSNNVFVASVNADVLDGEYLLGARALDSDRRMIEESPPLRVTLQTKSPLDAPKITAIGDIEVRGEKEVSVKNARPSLLGVSPCVNCEVYVVWQSLVGTSVILTDVTGGEFSTVPPFDLEPGEHTIDVVATRDSDGAVSEPSKAKLKITVAPAAAITPTRFKGAWPYILGGLAILLVLYGISRMIRKREEG